MTSTATSSDPFVRRLHTIQGLISAGKLTEAADRLNAARKSSPRDPRVYLLGSRLAEAANNPAGAEDAVRRAVAMSPDWVVAVTELAFLLARQNKFQDAISTAERAIQLDGDNPEVLARVIDVAHRAQNFDLANRWLTRAMALSPDNGRLKHLLARNLRLMGKHSEALALYSELIGANASDAEALLGRVQSSLALGNSAEARQDCAKLIELAPDNEEYQFWAAIARGETPARQPAAMVRTLYDGLAEVFDQHLVAGLKYKLPRDVAARIAQRYPDLKLNVLDLGCGTGLLGVCLGRIQGALIGVDVSTRMIDQAMRHNVYDRFHTVDLLDALEATPGELYDVITALDVFIYVGALDKAIPNALRILRPGGQLIFSCETATESEPDLVLRSTQRYAHKASHVESLCRAAGFADVSIEAMPLRYENHEPVQGFLVTASKPGA